MILELRLHNTLTGRVQALPRPEGKPFRFYACGPTVYGPAHIGNFRTFTMQDVLRRLLECCGQTVYHVRNITDVDDKTIRQSQAEGLSLKDFCAHWEKKFFADCARLGLLEPHVSPSAVAHIPEQIALIEQLVAKNHAYVGSDGSVYYRVRSFKEYGKLSGLHADELQTQASTSSGNANQADEYSREAVCDFALWKAYKPEDGPNRWPSPWGDGRPGWHIECSAMAGKYLGVDFELHGGGIDLIFPHHENEIAQSEACTCKRFAQHWFHVCHLKVEDQKMSKSLGNLYTLDDLERQGYAPAVVRYLLLSADYRQPLNFTFEGLHAAGKALSKLGKWTRSLTRQADLSWGNWAAQTKKASVACLEENPLEEFWKALSDDLSTPKALGALFMAVGKIDPEKLSAQEARRLLDHLSCAIYALGLSLPFAEIPEKRTPPAEVVALAEARLKAKQAKDFAAADALRRQISELGWTLTDTPTGYTLQ